jgi:hypothetical protein
MRGIRHRMLDPNLVRVVAVICHRHTHRCKGHQASSSIRHIEAVPIGGQR